MGLTRAEETTQNKHCRCVISAKILECKKVPFFAGSASPSEQKSESAAGPGSWSSFHAAVWTYADRCCSSLLTVSVLVL